MRMRKYARTHLGVDMRVSRLKPKSPNLLECQSAQLDFDHFNSIVLRKRTAICYLMCNGNEGRSVWTGMIR